MQALPKRARAERTWTSLSCLRSGGGREPLLGGGIRLRSSFVPRDPEPISGKMTVAPHEGWLDLDECGQRSFCLADALHPLLEPLFHAGQRPVKASMTVHMCKWPCPSCRKSTPVFWVPNNLQLSSDPLREAHRRWKSRVGKYLSKVERARPATVLGLAPTTGKRVFLSADGMKLGNPNARSSFHGDGSLTWSILVDPEHRPSLATVWLGSTISVASERDGEARS